VQSTNDRAQWIRRASPALPLTSFQACNRDYCRATA
jgi:hypothetical protein